MCQAYMYYYPATEDPLTVIESYPATVVQGNSPAFVSLGLRQSGIPITGGPILSRSTPPPPKPLECSTTSNKPYTVGTAGTKYLPMSRFDDSKYRNFKVLDPLGKYALYWNLLANKSTGNGIIQFAAEVETDGWLGFGISPNGGMIGSDIVLGWVDDVAGTVSLTDRKASATAQPPIDPTQDIFDVRGYKGLREQTEPEFNPIYYNLPVSKIAPRAGRVRPTVQPTILPSDMKSANEESSPALAIGTQEMIIIMTIGGLVVVVFIVGAITTAFTAPKVDTV